ncbi:caffeine-induced death protein 2 [Entophlyctis helioformis]|nr:caffeine-induced death protein 2 [Entophlyctis helioformis]
MEVCGDLNYFKQLLRTARAIDDNVIPKLNALTTRADRAESCRTFFQTLEEAYTERSSMIRQCLALFDGRIAESKAQRAMLTQGPQTAAAGTIVALDSQIRTDEMMKRQIQSEQTIEDIVRSRTHDVFASRCRGVPGTAAHIWAVDAASGSS